MPADHPSYTVLAPDTEVITELERKKSRFLTVLQRADSSTQAQELVDRLRKEHYDARHHCSAWAIGHDRRIQRANDDGEPSGTAGTPMLEALTKSAMPSGNEDLSDVVVVVVRWFGGTLLGAGGLVSAYSDSVVNVLDQARNQGAFLSRQRLRQFRLAAPIADVGRWEYELRQTDVQVLDADYGAQPQAAILSLAVADTPEEKDRLHTTVSTLSSGQYQAVEEGEKWVG